MKGKKGGQSKDTAGRIVVRPMVGLFLEDLDILTKMDPFCEIRYGQQLQKSKVCEQGGKYPRWNDVLTFNRTSDTTMNIVVQDQDMVLNELIGDGVLNLSRAFATPGVAHTEVVSLVRLGKTSGTVEFAVEFKPHV